MIEYLVTEAHWQTLSWTLPSRFWDLSRCLQMDVQVVHQRPSLQVRGEGGRENWTGASRALYFAACIRVFNKD